MTAFEGWCVVELLGHRVRYGRVSEVTMFGEAMLKLEIPTDPPSIEYYSGKALYGLRPASEESIRAYHAPRPALAAGREVLIDDAEFDADTGGQHDDDDWGDDEPIERPRSPAMDPINPELGGGS